MKQTHTLEYNENSVSNEFKSEHREGHTGCELGMGKNGVSSGFEYQDEDDAHTRRLKGSKWIYVIARQTWTYFLGDENHG